MGPGGLHEEPSSLEAEGEGAAGLKDGEDTHQPLLNAELGELPIMPELALRRPTLRGWAARQDLWRAAPD